MADLTEFVFETDKGKRILVLDDHAIGQLSAALATMRVDPAVRADILSGRKKVPPLLYNRFHKMMQKRLGGSPVRIEVEGGGTAVFTEAAAGRGRGKATRGRAKSLSIEDQIAAKRRRKREDEREGRIYRDFLPVTIGATIGRGKGDPTSNIFAIGKHRGTIYAIEEISAPVPLPPARDMPKTASGRKRAQKAALAPYLWQARVLSHPWTRLTRGGFAERGGAGSAPTSGLAGLHRVGELTTHEFPTFSGKTGWKGAVADVEKAIDTSYIYRVSTGNVPPELERYVKEEIAKVREGGRTPALAPRRRTGTSGTVRQRRGGRAIPVVRKKKDEENPKKKAKKKTSKKKTSKKKTSKKKTSKKKTGKKRPSKRNPPTRNGVIEDWKERREAAKDAQQAIKSKLSAEAAISRHAAKEAEKEEKRAEKAKERASRSAERERKRAVSEKYRAEQIAEHGEIYGTPSYAVGRGLGKLAAGSRKATARFAKMFTKTEEKKVSAAVRGQRSVFTDLGKRHMNKFEGSFKKWQKSAADKKPEFAQLLDSYDNLLFAHAYLTLGGKDDRTARALDQIRESLLTFLKCADPSKVDIVSKTIMKEARSLSGFKRGNPKNPTAEVHQEMGEGFLAESEKLWASYCKTRSTKTLLDAYRVLELACQEFEYTGDKKRMAQAKEGIKAARAEITAGMKAPTKKKAKKRAKKKATKKAK